MEGRTRGRMSMGCGEGQNVRQEVQRTGDGEGLGADCRGL